MSNVPDTTPIFFPVVLDEDEDAACPDEKCTFNKPDLHYGRRGFTASGTKDFQKIYCVYCPYCRNHLTISKIKPI